MEPISDIRPAPSAQSTAPTPSLSPRPRTSHSGIVLLIVTALILLGALWILAQKQGLMTDPDSDGQGNAVTRAPQGTLVDGFPIDLVISEGTDITSSYAIEYADEGKTMPVASFASGLSFDEAIAAYDLKLWSSGWTIVKGASDDEDPVTNIYATRGSESVNVTIAREGADSTSIQVAYVSSSQQ